MVATVEQLTGIELDYYMLTDFGGFAQVLDEIGGLYGRSACAVGRLQHELPGGGAAGSKEAMRCRSLTWESLQNGDFGRSENQGLLMISSARPVPEGILARQRSHVRLARSGLAQRPDLAVDRGTLGARVHRDERQPRWRHEPRRARKHRYDWDYVDRAAVTIRWAVVLRSEGRWVHPPQSCRALLTAECFVPSLHSSSVLRQPSPARAERTKRRPRPRMRPHGVHRRVPTIPPSQRPGTDPATDPTGTLQDQEDRVPGEREPDLRSPVRPIPGGRRRNHGALATARRSLSPSRTDDSPGASHSFTAGITAINGGRMNCFDQIPDGEPLRVLRPVRPRSQIPNYWALRGWIRAWRPLLLEHLRADVR